MTKDSPEYKQLIHVGSAVVCFLIAMAFAYGFHKTGVPYLLVFTGWFLRSVMARTKESKSK